MERDASLPGLRTIRAWLPAIVAALCAILVYRGALGGFFGQDDFVGLARARGLLPALPFPWRWISGQLYFAFMRPFGTDGALAYHAVSLAAHALTAALLARVLARRVGTPAALLGAVFFAVHPAHFTALYSVSGIGELLAPLFALAALDVAMRRDRWRWLAPALFALALLCKENLVLLPAVLLLRDGWLGSRDPGGAEDSHRSPRAMALALGIVSVVMAGMLALTDPFGARTALPESSAYAWSMGPHVLGNLATYAAWTVNFAFPTVRSVSDSIDPGGMPAALAALALWLSGLMWPALRRRGWLAGGLTWLAFLLPVLALPHHTYHYYLHAPLLGAALCVSALADALFAVDRARGATRHGSTANEDRRLVSASSIAVIVAGLLVMNGAVLVSKIETFPFTLPGLRADATVDRARIARAARDDLRSAYLPAGVALRFWSPTSIRLELEARPGSDPLHRETYWEQNVRTALYDGLGVRVLFPAVGDVRFVREYTPAPDSVRYALYEPDGRVSVLSSSGIDSLLGARDSGTPPASHSRR
jgi:hypothetical protein